MRNAKELPYKFGVVMQVYPSSRQKQIINKNINFARFYWNNLVRANKEIAKLKHTSEFFSWPWAENRIAWLKDLANPNCKIIKQMFVFANDPDLDSNVPMQEKYNYNTAWNLYKKVKSVRPPKFHKKDAFGSYQTSGVYNPSKYDKATIYNGSVKFLDDTHIQLPKIGSIRVAFSKKRYLRLKEMVDDGKELRITKAKISRDACGDYYVSFQIAADERISGDFDKTGSQIGIDLNVKNFLTDSNGNTVANPKFYRQAKTALAKAQRKLGKRCARAKKEGRAIRTAKNYQKQRELVAKIQRRVLRRRHMFLDLLSTTLIKNHDLVAAEELRSKNLQKNHALAMSISDVGWRTFLSMLEYKAEMHGKKFVTVNPRNTTQTCSHCGHVLAGDKKLTLDDREWTCPVCGIHHDRDHNAAKNILAKAFT